MCGRSFGTGFALGCPNAARIKVLYRIYSLDGAGTISGPARVFECQSDDAAQTIASTLRSDHDGVEVWAGTRRVARLGDQVRPASTYLQIDTRTFPAILGQGKSIAIPAPALRENRRISAVKVVLTRLMHRWIGMQKLLWEDPACKPRQAGFSGRGMIEQVEKAS
jgi:hypothetical protein